MIQSTAYRWLHRYSVLVAFCTFLLIVAGALVTSNDAGLSVPDWPTSFGSFRMPRMTGGVKFEHGHRMIAATVGFLTVLLAVWTWRMEPRRWVRRLAAMAVLTVVLQGVLGGVTVLFYLPVPISVGHACLAQVFFCLTVSLALFTSDAWSWEDRRLKDSSSPPLRHLAVVTTMLVFVQLMLGAAFRHKGFGILPHIVVAALVTVCVLWLLVRTYSQFAEAAPVRKAILWMVGLLGSQIALGVGSYIEKIAYADALQPMTPVIWFTTAHVAVGALVLACSLYLTYQVFRYVGPGHEDSSRVLVASRERIETSA